jgi:hypothetical protein
LSGRILPEARHNRAFSFSWAALDVVRKLAAYRGWANFEDEVGRQIGIAVQEAEAE